MKIQVIAALAVLFLINSASLASDSGRFYLEGVLSHEIISTSKQVVQLDMRYFTVAFDDCKWRIRTYPSTSTNDSAGYWEAAFDGEQLRVVRFFGSDRQPVQKREYKQGVGLVDIPGVSEMGFNAGSGLLVAGEQPPVNQGFISYVWLAYVSGVRASFFD